MGIFDRAAGTLAVQPKHQVPFVTDISKAITTDSAPTMLDQGCAERLIDFMEDESELLGLMNVVRMDSNVQNLSYINVSTGLLVPGGCETDDSNCDTGTVIGTQQTLTTHEFKAVIPLCDNVLEDNIEGAAFEDHLLQMVAKQLANEIETWVLMASTPLVYHSPIVRDSVMSTDDTLYQILQTGHVINAGASANGRFIDECKVQEMIQTLPTKYRKKIPDMMLFMPDDMKWDWVGRLKQRQTELGDRTFGGAVRLGFGDLDFAPLPLLPTDIVNCSAGSQAGNGTFMFLADPDNLVFGVQRQITFERERKGCQGRTFLIWTLRIDALIDNVDATVLYDCMRTKNCEVCDCP